ncbi:MAG: response regulator [Chloroflexota bacterium]
MTDKYILVVDDQKMMRRLAGDILRSRGFRVLLAESGQRCLELHKQYGPGIGCVLLDINMPSMNGYETFAALRATDPTLSIIFCTSYDKNKRELRAVLSSKNVSYLRKPYAIDELLMEIRLMLAEPVSAAVI